MPTNHKRHNTASRGSANELATPPEQPVTTVEAPATPVATGNESLPPQPQQPSAQQQQQPPPAPPQQQAPPKPAFPPLFITNMVPPNRSSSPAYNVVMPKIGNVIFYCLIDAKGNPTKVRGQIIVAAIPRTLNVPSIGG